VRNLVHSHTRRLARYLCENCGFKARQFYCTAGVRRMGNLTRPGEPRNSSRHREGEMN